MWGILFKFVGNFSASENEGFTTITRAEHSTLQKFTFTEDSIAFFSSNLKYPISLVLSQINVICYRIMKILFPTHSCLAHTLWMLTEGGITFLFKHTFWIKVYPTDLLSQTCIFVHVLSQGRHSKYEIHVRDHVEGLPWKYRKNPLSCLPSTGDDLNRIISDYFLGNALNCDPWHDVDITYVCSMGSRSISQFWWLSFPSPHILTYPGSHVEIPPWKRACQSECNWLPLGK